MVSFTISVLVSVMVSVLVQLINVFRIINRLSSLIKLSAFICRYLFVLPLDVESTTGLQKNSKV
tara:strand:- start:331 stop:522 length:192 start_codon:yes stop_codon:yes gene_type:complete